MAGSWLDFDADADVDADTNAEPDVDNANTDANVDGDADNTNADANANAEPSSLAAFGVEPTTSTEQPASQNSATPSAPHPLRADGGKREQGGHQQVTLDDTTWSTGDTPKAVAVAAHENTTSEASSNATGESENEAHSETGSKAASQTGRESESEPESKSDRDPVPDSKAESSDPRCTAYRHDVYKLFGRKHEAARERVGGVPVNEPVPLGADGDAALLSRPAGEPSQTVTNHLSPLRLSLLTGSPPKEADKLQLGEFHPDFAALIEPPTAEQLHAEWLTSGIAGAICESVYYPYTSLKYHTLFVAALLDNYRAGYRFSELSLVATPGAAVAGPEGDAEAALASDSVVSHRTVCWTPALALHITGAPGERPSTPIGEIPARSFADVWSRLPAHPIDADHTREAQLLDAQLRRIRSWSTALQYIEDVVTGRGPMSMSEWGGLDA